MKQLVLRLIGALGVACLAASCATAYDAQGRQVQVVTPEGAAATALVAGLIGYAIGNDNDRDCYRSGGYYGGGYGGYRRGGYCGY